MVEVELNQLITLIGVSLGILIGIFAFVFTAIYVYISLVLMTIAKKTETKHAWLAWIPIANLYLMSDIGGFKWWTVLIVLFAGLIPYAGAVIVIAMMLWWWYGIAKARDKSGLLGILMILPIVNLIILGYLAWSE